MKRWGLFVISAVVLILVGAATIWHSRSGGPGDMIQEATPQAILKHIRELDAPLVLVNFWASWC
ncbi:MAG TPA: hypothetical protein PKC28_16310, partial [Bdellovibrionales bacterium]|nr:hypothetical protein [Bdellovibrionales bacterium]